MKKNTVLPHLGLFSYLHSIPRTDDSKRFRNSQIRACRRVLEGATSPTPGCRSGCGPGRGGSHPEGREGQVKVGKFRFSLQVRANGSVNAMNPEISFTLTTGAGVHRGISFLRWVQYHHIGFTLQGLEFAASGG